MTGSDGRVFARKTTPAPPHHYGRAGFFVTFFLFLETFFLFMDYCFLSSDATTLFWMPKPDHLLAKNSIAAARNADFIMLIHHFFLDYENVLIAQSRIVAGCLLFFDTGTKL